MRAGTKKVMVVPTSGTGAPLPNTEVNEAANTAANSKITLGLFIIIIGSANQEA